MMFLGSSLQSLGCAQRAGFGQGHFLQRLDAEELEEVFATEVRDDRGPRDAELVIALRADFTAMRPELGHVL